MATIAHLKVIITQRTQMWWLYPSRCKKLLRFRRWFYSSLYSVGTRMLFVCRLQSGWRNDKPKGVWSIPDNILFIICSNLIQSTYIYEYFSKPDTFLLYLLHLHVCMGVGLDLNLLTWGSSFLYLLRSVYQSYCLHVGDTYELC